MGKKSYLLKNTLTIGLGRLSTQLISFMLLPLYTLYLSLAEYGAIDLIVTYVALLVPLLTVQLDRAAFRHLVDARGDDAEITRIISNVLRFITTTLLICVLIYMAVGLFIIQIPYFILVMLVICSTIYSNLFLQIARGFGQNKQYAIASIFTGLATLFGALFFVVFLRMGANGVLASLLFANLASTIYLFFKLRIYAHIRIRSNDARLTRELLSFSLPLVPSGASWWAINAADRTIITIVLGVAANGIYAIANKYSMIFTSLYSIFDMSWTESASMHINSKDRDMFFSDVYNSVLRLFGTFGLVMIAATPFVFGILVRGNFQQAYIYVPILILGAFMNAIVSMYSTVYIAKKLTNKVLRTSLLSAAISVTLNLVLIGFIGLFASAIANVLAFLSMAVLRHFDIKKYVNITYERDSILGLVILYTVAIGLYYFNHSITNTISLAMFTLLAIYMNRAIAVPVWFKFLRRIKK